MGNRSLFPVVAVPLAFFGTFFRTERKYCPSQGSSPTVRAVVGASIPRSGFPSGKVGVHRHRQVAFHSLPARLPKQNSTPIRLHLYFRAVVGAPFHRLGGEILTTESLTADKSRGSFLGTNTRQTTACRFLPLEKNSTACTAVPSVAMLKNKPDRILKPPGKCKATALLPYSSFAMSSASVIMFVSMVWRSSAVMARLSSPMMSLTVRMPSAFLCR